VDPEPSDLFRHVDLYGNTKSYFHVVEPHTKLVVTATSLVEVDPPRYSAEALGQPWEECRPLAAGTAGSRDADGWRATDYVFASTMVDIPPGIRDYASLSFTTGRSVGDAVTELMHRVHQDFTYKSGSTTVSTRVAELLERRTGVCQDFTHFMVSGLRSLGLAGRYVSGYLATRPAPGKPRLVGADASHAWVGCWIPGNGWMYLDPTNDRLIDASHATVAWGRDYADVTPVKGVIFTEAKKSTMKVSVDMAPLD
jgi:transglutaminase-like putative cysteine protease